jgi:ABC-type bacteriocin/lantibiotic exporter with double-glycine peptidase domain
MSSRRFFVPEVVQTSAIDCGPACLKSLLGGFGIHASYGRLREACQTTVDGTSVDTIEDLANRLGLEAEQIVIPPDHIVLPEAAALPAMVVVRQPGGLTHFVIVWRRIWRKLQVMDPATGRRSTPIDPFRNDLYVHEMIVPAMTWRDWTQSDEFTAALKARLKMLGVSSRNASKQIANALSDPLWRAIATLDAAVRMLTSLARSPAFRKHVRMYPLLTATIRKAMENPEEAERLIPADYWSVRPAGEEGLLAVRGAVLVRVKGRKAPAAERADLPPEVAAAASEPPARPAAELWQSLKRDGVLRPCMVGAAFVAAAAATTLQAVLFRAFIAGGEGLAAQGQRLGGVGALLALLLILLGIDTAAMAMLIRMGRRLEMRFRMAFLAKLPRIAERYFHSRLASDMAERGHNVHKLRGLPVLGGELLRGASELIVTTAAVIWIDLRLWPIAVLLAATGIGLPVLVQPMLGERQLRVRTHAGALARFYFDALAGIVPIRAHAAERVVRAEHRTLLAKWAEAGFSTERIAIALEGAELVLGYGLAAVLVISHASRYPESSALLLLAYWSLNIPVIGRDVAALASQYPRHRNVALRLLEPLQALEDQPGREPASSSPKEVVDHPQQGVKIAMEEVSVMASGHSILNAVTVDIPAGGHVAIVGPSGAGKSTLVRLLLGWGTLASGALRVDDLPASPEAIERLRRHTAWIDPTVKLWNRSLVDNLRFGATGGATMPIGQAVDEVELTSVLERLPDGLQTELGDSGGLLSGGEGQRVRVGRAMLRSGVQLVIMDEPFRGLDSRARRRLLERARRLWRHATMLFVTHEVADALAFDRLLVMEAGTIVEDGIPSELARRPDSRYGEMLHLEAQLKQRLLRDGGWRQFIMRDGVLSEDPERSVAPEREADYFLEAGQQGLPESRFRSVAH